MKRILLGLALLLAAAPLCAQSAHRFDSVLTRGANVQANVVPYATIRVCSQGSTGTPCTPLASVFYDAALTQPITQPLPGVVADASGNFSYYTALMCVDEQYSSPGQTVRTVQNVCLTSGSGTPLTLKTNSTSNASQVQLNFTNTTDLHFSNPSGGVESGAVTGLQGNAVANTTPAQNAVPNWSVSGNRYEISPLTQDQILPGFAISTFTCSTCATVEIGATIASPTNFTASYTSLPGSASISDGTHSTTLTTPFTSGSLAFSYTQTTVACTTYTLQAIAATTQTVTRQSCWVPRSFGGTGTGGSATSATASGNTAVLVGATGTLVAPTSGAALATSCTGQVYNVTTSGTQYVYLLLPCNVSNPTAGSFTVPGPSVFPMNTPTTITFTNQFSASVTMYLYRSVNSFFTGSNSIITVGN